MSLGVAIKGPEGVVLAADSRVTLTVPIPGQNVVIPATYDNATKLLSVLGQTHIGVITYGLGAIGQNEPRTAHSFMPEFEDSLHDSPRLTVQGFSQRFSDFFLQKWQTSMPAQFGGPGMVFLIGGYDEQYPYGKVFQVEIPNQPVPLEHFASQGEFGIVYGGQREIADRIVQGFDDSLPHIIQARFNLSDQQRNDLREELRRELTVKVPFAFLPLQDCVDVAIFLVRATIGIQSWFVGIRGVGGAIDVATVTRTKGFEPVQQKRIVGKVG
jgi:hypothetical protein